MTLLELCQLYWWSINDLEANPLLMPKATIIAFVNDALRELSQGINYRKYASIVPSTPLGTITLPADIIKLERVTWGATELTPVLDIRSVLYVDPDEDDTDTTTDVSKYYPMNRTTIQVYPTPLATDVGPCNVWYRAYLPVLALDADIPSDVPAEYHKDLVLVFVRAQHALKLGRYSEYQFLSDLWEEIKKEVFGVYLARTEKAEAHTPLDYEW